MFAFDASALRALVQDAVVSALRSTEGRDAIKEANAAPAKDPMQRLTVKQAAEESGLSQHTIYKWIEGGRIKRVRDTGRKVLVFRRDLPGMGGL